MLRSGEAKEEGVRKGRVDDEEVVGRELLQSE